MKFELTPQNIEQIDRMLKDGQKLRAIAKAFKVSESTLRWRLARAGWQVLFTGRLSPIHAEPINGQAA